MCFHYIIFLKWFTCALYKWLLVLIRCKFLRLHWRLLLNQPYVTQLVLASPSFTLLSPVVRKGWQKTSINRAFIMPESDKSTHWPHTAHSIKVATKAQRAYVSCPRSEKVGGKIAQNLRSAGSKIPTLFIRLYGLVSPTGLPSLLFFFQIHSPHPLELSPLCFKLSGQT